jgi:hypothetical protein
MDRTSSVSNGAWPQTKMQAHEMGKNDPKTAILNNGAFRPKPIWAPRKGRATEPPVCRKHGSPTCPPIVKILNGANPANLPFERPTKYELVVNLKNCPIAKSRHTA